MQLPEYTGIGSRSPLASSPVSLSPVHLPVHPFGSIWCFWDVEFWKLPDFRRFSASVSYWGGWQLSASLSRIKSEALLAAFSARIFAVWAPTLQVQLCMACRSLCVERMVDMPKQAPDVPSSVLWFALSGLIKSLQGNGGLNFELTLCGMLSGPATARKACRTPVSQMVALLPQGWSTVWRLFSAAPEMLRFRSTDFTTKQSEGCARASNLAPQTVALDVFWWCFYFILLLCINCVINSCSYHYAM